MKFHHRASSRAIISYGTNIVVCIFQEVAFHLCSACLGTTNYLVAREVYRMGILCLLLATLALTIHSKFLYLSLQFYIKMNKTNRNLI